MTIHGATGVDLSAKTLSQLVGSGHLKLGGLAIHGVATIATTESALRVAALSPFDEVTLAAEGAVYAKGFTGGYLLATFDKTYADDVWSVAGTGISIGIDGRSVSLNGAVVASVDSTSNGVGTALKLAFDFSGTSLSVVAQAEAVQTLAQGITYSK